MKNKFKLLGIILVSLFIFPITAKALEYNTLNFKEVLADEAIEEKFADYKETKDQLDAIYDALKDIYLGEKVVVIAVLI